MDAVIQNLLADIPVVTKTWMGGSVIVSILSSLRLIDPGKLIYNWDLVFHKGQYQRILFSVLDFGDLNWSSICNIAISTNHLSMLESSFADKGRFIWIIFVLLVLIILMSGYVQPVSSLGNVLHENLVYFELKKNGQNMNIMLFGGINVATSIIPLYMYFMMYFIQRRSLLEISMNFLPAHIIFYMEDTIWKLYHVDLCKTPYDLWMDLQPRLQRGNFPEQPVEVETGEATLDVPPIEVEGTEETMVDVPPSESSSIVNEGVENEREDPTDIEVTTTPGSTEEEGQAIEVSQREEEQEQGREEVKTSPGTPGESAIVAESANEAPTGEESSSRRASTGDAPL